MKLLLLIGAFIVLYPSAGMCRPATDYTDYFRGILKAEEHIAAKDLPAALRAYTTLFEQRDFVFARDAYNALQVAILCGNSAQADKLITRCAKYGVSQNAMARNSIISRYYASDKDKYTRLYAWGEAVYLKRIDAGLREEFQQRFNLEQGSKGTARYKQIVTDNYNRIASLAKEGRFPGEQLIGVNDELTNSVVFATLLHYPYAYRELSVYLWEAVRKGEAQPLSLIYLYGFNQTRTSILYTSDMPEDSQHFKACYNVPFGKHSGNMAAVDSANDAAYLHTVEMDRRIDAAARESGMHFMKGW